VDFSVSAALSAWQTLYALGSLNVGTSFIRTSSAGP
jgi:hypothetical protein